MAEDTRDDLLQVRNAFEECGADVALQVLQGGDALMDYLRRRGRYAEAAAYPLPGLIILGFGASGRSSRKALAEIKTDPGLKAIPVLVMATIARREDILECYRLGANSFIVKPESFSDLVEIARTIHYYWFNLSSLPGRRPE